jgi:hypothetical protein
MRRQSECEFSPSLKSLTARNRFYRWIPAAALSLKIVMFKLSSLGVSSEQISRVDFTGGLPSSKLRPATMRKCVDRIFRPKHRTRVRRGALFLSARSYSCSNRPQSDRVRVQKCRNTGFLSRTLCHLAVSKNAIETAL